MNIFEVYMKKLNVVMGKFGKSILFNKENWGAHGGDNEAPLVYTMLAKNNPHITFYI